MKRKRLIKNVEDKIWRLFAGHAKLLGLTQAEFLKMLIEIYLKKGEKEK